ncbi:tetratricopeptide repeat protein [Streptomyces sp. T12]|uniref:tetratricopeptide repeat protein n=1 Tax=Streptomyces sp. T12 TaxID=477697 RepID=UPI002365DFA4|nr:tetratricopeptide repeat protein [Streptomyces sp. T12]WDF36969.1 tetratricopeptide repeat protein [Streptomyces sp. T12]
MAPRTNDTAPENEEKRSTTGADAAAAGGEGEAGTDERVAAVRRVGAARRRERQEPSGEVLGDETPGETRERGLGLSAPVRAFQPVRGYPLWGRLRTRPVQGRSGGLGAASRQGAGSKGRQPLEDGTSRGGGGEETPDQRIATVRRAAAAARRRRALHLAGCTALLAIAFTAGSLALGAAHGNTDQSVEAASAALSPGLLAGGDLDAGISSLQAHLRDQPRDFSSWSTLGLAYVEQARTKGDPSRYPQADRAFERSLSLEPDNDQALAGRAALAAARHDFEDALKYADQSLKVNPYSERALCTRVDALVELGRYADAAKAADTADDRRPGIPVFTRYAYVRELRGDVRTAERVLEQALSSAVTPGDIAYVATQLGQLAWNQGDYDTALTHYARALAADENYVPALEGRARAQAASGDRAGALKGLRDVVSRYPLPGPLVELGELYEAAGDKVKADDQYALVDAWTALARANGVNADLDTALAAADHGDKASALRAARAEWDRRRTVHTADALAWALHVNGKDEEALPYARRATATGYRNAAFHYHRGMIERATGHTEDAREHLQAALKLNPGFSPLGAREARTALKDLEPAK